ncbi:MAG: DUF5522 domain-containing protein [Flavobacteriales bacterium]
MNKSCIPVFRLHVNLSIRVFAMDNNEESGIDFSEFGKRSKLSEEDYYLSDEGYIVFKESYHLKRGYCCKSNCKHCPYGYQRRTDRITK